MPKSEPFARAAALSRPRRRLRHRTEASILGISVRFESDAASAARAAEALYTHAHAFPEPAEGEPASRIPHIYLQLTETVPPAAAGPLSVRTPEAGRLLAAGDGAEAHADAATMHAVARLHPELLEQPARLRELLDTLVLFLVTRLDRQPVHAAGVVIGCKAVVLAGPSGTGKSTLSYCALRAGFRVLADDAVYVQLAPRLRVWGGAGPLHLRPEAAAGFPELHGRPTVLRANGQTRIQVAQPSGPGRPFAEEAALCLLERGSGPATLEPVRAEQAVEQILGSLDPGFDAFRQTIAPCLHALAAGGAWRLRLSEQPEDALACLTARLGGVPTQAGLVSARGANL